MKISIEKYQTIDRSIYTKLSKEIFDETDDDLYKSLWELSKLVSKEDYEYFLELLISLNGPIYLPVYLGVFEELISCFNELIATDLFIDDGNLHLTVKLLKLFNDITAKKLKVEFDLSIKLNKNLLNGKYSKFPFFASLSQPYDETVPDMVCRNIRLLTALFIISKVRITEPWGTRLRKLKGAIYKYNLDDIFDSLSLNVDSLSELEGLCFRFDIPKTTRENYSTYSFEDLQKYLFNHCLTPEQQDRLKPKCPLLFDEDEIFSREMSDAHNARYNQRYFNEFKNSQSTKKLKFSKKPLEIVTNVTPKDIQQVEIHEDKTKKSKNRKYTKNIKPSISSRNFIPNITEKNKGDEVDTSAVTLDRITDATIIDDSYKSADYLILNGSRLRLIERLNLPCRTNYLFDFEVKIFIDYLLSELISSDAKNRQDAVMVLLMLITSKSEKELLQLLINKGDKKSRIEHINLETGLWVRDDIKLTSFKFTSKQKKLLNPILSKVSFSLPSVLINSLNEILYSSVKIEAIYRYQPIHKSLQDCLSRFNELKLLNRNITLSSVRGYMFSRLSEQHDPNFAALLLANSEFIEPTHLYYLSAGHEYLQSAYYAQLNKMGFKLDKSTHNYVDEESFSGSELSVSASKLSLKIKELTTQLDQLDFNDAQSAIKAHNSMVLYTVLMLIACTTHRPRNEYSFSDYSINDDLCLIADKIQYDDSKIRVNPLPTMMVDQIDSYRNHCKYVSKYLNKDSKELHRSLIDISTGKNVSFPIFGYITSDLQWVPISKAQIDEYFFNEINLPSNLFRSFMASSLRNTNFSKYSLLLLGHISAGEHPLSKHSLCTISDIKVIKESLEEVLKQVGFIHINVPIKSGRSMNPLHFNKSEITYRPSYLINTGIPKNTLLKWARKQVEPYKEKLKESPIRTTRGITLHDCSDQNINKKIIDIAIQNSIIANHTKAESSQAIKFVNRFINRLSNHHRDFSWDTIRYESRWGEFKTSILQDQKSIGIIGKIITNYLQRNIDDTIEPILKIVLSFIVNTRFLIAIDVQFIAALKNGIQESNNLYWLVIDNKSNNQFPLFIDSITATLIDRYSEQIFQSNVSEKQLEKYYQNFRELYLSGLGADISLYSNTLKRLSHSIANCFDSNIPSLLRYFRTGSLKVSSLNENSVTRFANQTQINTTKKLSSKSSAKKTTSQLLPTSNDVDINLSNDLISKIIKNLNLKKHPKASNLATESFINAVVIKNWSNALESETISVAELTEGSAVIDQTTILSIYWTLNVAKRRGRQRKDIAVSTVLTYLSKTAKAFLQINQGREFTNFDESELEQFYIDALELKPEASRKDYARIFRDFHNSVRARFNLSDVDWYYIEPNIDNKGADSDANLISMSEYKNALSLLANDECSDPTSRRIHLLTLILCYRLGLRRGEVRRLLVGNIDVEHWIIHIKTNKFGRTKSKSSNRRINAYSLLSQEEKDLIIKQIEYIKIIHKSEKREGSIPLFSTSTNVDKLIDFNPIADRVMEALRLVTGDETLKLHHCRHSFASYMLMLLATKDNESVFYKQLIDWSRCDEDLLSFCKKLRIEQTNEAEVTVKILPALALMIGHSDPITTLTHYIHILNMMLWDYNESVISQNYSIKYIADLTSQSHSNCRKTLSRYKIKDKKVNYLVLKAINSKNLKSFHYVPGQYSNVNIQLKNKRLNDNSIYEKINLIDGVIQANKNSTSNELISALYNVPEIKIEQIQKLIQEVKNNTGYLGVIGDDSDSSAFKENEKKVNQTASYLKNTHVKTILSKILSEYKINKTFLKELAYSWQSSYDYRFGLLNKVDVTDNTIFKLIRECSLFCEKGELSTINFNFKKIECNQIHIKLNSKNKYNINDKFNYICFLISVFVEL